jgi:hypothetical protein
MGLGGTWRCAGDTRPPFAHRYRMAGPTSRGRVLGRRANEPYQPWVGCLEKTLINYFRELLDTRRNSFA